MTVREHNIACDSPNLWVWDSACKKLWRAPHCRCLQEGGDQFPSHAQHPSPREDMDKSGTGYTASRRTTPRGQWQVTFSHTPPINPGFIQCEFTVPWKHHGDSHLCDFLFSQSRMLCFALLLAHISLSKSRSVIPFSRKSLHPHLSTPGHSPIIALTHYMTALLSVSPLGCGCVLRL